MPRGRHRHSPPLHRLLPPSAIAGVSLVCALGPWVTTAPVVLRLLSLAAAATAVTGAVVMRRWDAQAGRKVAELTRARTSDEWRFEERLAELEADLEESRELRTRLENKLRAKRAELSGLRNEHAALLRRYATAETERASALEGRRQLQLEAGHEARALPAAAADRPGTAPAGTPDAPAAGRVALSSPEGAELFRRAGAALARLTAAQAAPADRAPAAAGARDAVAGSGGRVQPPGGHLTVPPAVAVVPAAPAPRPVTEGGFDFFGTKSGTAKGTRKKAPAAALEAVQDEDLADVVGEEALAARQAESESNSAPTGAGPVAAGQVIDLTAHDETEQIDFQQLRSAAS
ncbi:hypothetical protein ACPCIY_25445 [Streptomyces thermodiastaticus]